MTHAKKTLDTNNSDVSPARGEGQLNRWPSFHRATTLYYELKHPQEGVGSGFKYKTVPHITLKSIANNLEIREGMRGEQIDAAIAKYAEQETLYHQPSVDKSRARVSGPLAVEAVPAPTARSISELGQDQGFGPTVVEEHKSG